MRFTKGRLGVRYTSARATLIIDDDFAAFLAEDRTDFSDCYAARNNLSRHLGVHEHHVPPHDQLARLIGPDDTSAVLAQVSRLVGDNQMFIAVNRFQVIPGQEETFQ